MIRVTVWNEFHEEKIKKAVSDVYPNGIHTAVAEGIDKSKCIVRTVTQDDEECGLSEEILDNTDVLIWWAHAKHEEMPDNIAERVQNAVLKGMGIIFLHSSHKSKPFMRLMGTTGDLSWREDGDKERIWVVNPAHPISKGIDKYF